MHSNLLAPCVVSLLVLCSTFDDVRGADAAALAFKVSPQFVIEGITQELSIDCRPSSSLHKETLMGLLIDILRTDDSDTPTFVARQLTNTHVMEDNRTTADGNMKTPENSESSFINVNVKDPGLSEEGVYTCRYIYLDNDHQIKHLSISTNVTLTVIPPPEILPEVVVQAEPEVEPTGCACDEIWDEINLLKAAMVKKNEIVKQEVQSSDGSCRVSFSAKFPGMRSYPINSEGLAPFHDVITNKGGAYDVKKAAFIAPCSGQYFFSLTLRSQQELDSGYVDGSILVDGKEVARTSVFVDTPINNYESATNGAVVSLDKGQEVKVQIRTTSFGKLRGSSYSLFSGFFLFP